MTIVIADALSQVDVTGLAVALGIVERCVQHCGLTIRLDAELNLLRRVREALAVPDKVAYILLVIMIEIL